MSGLSDDMEDLSDVVTSETRMGGMSQPADIALLSVAKHRHSGPEHGLIQVAPHQTED